MNYAAKVMKKFGLGDAATGMLAPFSGDRSPLPAPEEAASLLQELRPDAGRSALRETPLSEAEPFCGVDVIIPVYNAGAFLRPCLDSVFSQKTLFPFRVIAVDDGSTDGSGAVLDAWADPRLTVIHQENRGAAAARNRGIDASRSRWLFFLDADDLMSPDCLQTLLDKTVEAGAILAEAAYCTIDDTGKKLTDCPHEAGPMDPRRCTGYPPGKLWDRSLFRDVCFPAGYCFEDSVLAQLLLPLAERSGLPVLGISSESFRYRMHRSSAGHTSRGSEKSLDSLWVTLSLWKDRQALGLPSDQGYYEYLLNMLVLTRHRTEALGDGAGKAVFALQREFLLAEFSSFSTERRAFRMLEQAVRDGDYGRYRLFCSLH